MEAYAKRFGGISIDYRKNEPTWEKPWSLKVYANKVSNKKERIVKYFDSYEDLINYIESK